jgi:serine/threonine protein kinase
MSRNQMAGVNNQNSETVGSYDATGAAAARARERDAVIGITIKDRYLIEEQLGTGGFGAVYLARDLKLLSKRVVIKLLHEKSLQNEWAVRKFKHEIEALTRIDHPGVVGVLDTGSMTDGVPFIVMQYVEGASLRSLMKRAPAGMDLHQAADIIHQIGCALTAAHEKGIIHRDLKPENIMIRSVSGDDDQVKIIDFGIAKVKDSQLAPSTVVVATAGTIDYMAPEQLNARPVSGSTDTYSLGAIAYEMLTGRRPFNPETHFQLAEMQRAGARIKPTDLRPALPKGVDGVVLQALSYNPEARYSSARAFADALCEELMESTLTGSRRVVDSKAETIAMTHVVAAQSVPSVHARHQLKTSKRNTVVLLAAGLLLAAIVALAVWPRLSFKTAGDQPANNPAKTTAVVSRSIDYYLMVQKYLPNGKAYQGPFKATGNDILGDGWRFSVHTSSPQDGLLYLVNEGPAAGGGFTYNLLFPTPKINGGSARVEAGQDRDIGPYGLDAHQGTEKFWLVWSAAPVAELEAVKSVVNLKEKGTVSDPQRIEAIRDFLERNWASKPVVEIDRPNSLVHVKAKSDLLVNLMELEHH